MPLFGKRSVEPEKERKRIYSEDEIKERLESMNPDMQNTFIRLAEMLMHKESQMFLDIVAKSRQDIQEVGESIKEEQEVLKTTAKILARERNGADGLEYADVEDSEGGATKIHYESEYNKKVVQDYLKAVGRDVPSRGAEVQKRRNYKPMKSDSSGYVPEYARRVGTGAATDRPYTASGSRPGTAYRMRMSRQDDEVGSSGAAAVAVSASWQDEPRQRERTMEENAKVKEEKEELMEQMKMMDDMMQGEKARQQEALQARKEARKARQEQKKAEEETQVMELLETNQEAEEQKRKSKERQEQILKERLAKKRLERRKTLQDMAAEEPVGQASSHVPAGELAQELERELGITRAKTSLAPPEDEAAGKPKKKGGKKKKQQDAEPPAPVEANWDVGGGEETGKKSKKKKKTTEQPALTEVEPAVPAADDGKKKKKKKAAPAADPPADTVLNLEVGGEGERKKKGKKKKLSNDMDLAVSEV